MTTLLVLHLLLTAAPTRAAARVPTNARLEARACFALRQEEGVAACQHALLHPGNRRRSSNLRLMLALHLASLNRNEEVVTVYQALTLDQPNNALFHLRLGEALLYGVHRPAEAVPCLQRAIELDNTLAPAFGSLGTALSELSRFKESQAAFEQAQRHDPEYFELRPAARLIYESVQKEVAWPE
ncbi:MAG: hypothetical protein MUF51_01125 [Vicinamibacteria bacterium]|jgi:tetratricopeptide (TPR) repeat protein|nr:hypothetical protein [Vicinamibacteria bacterium]